MSNGEPLCYYHVQLLSSITDRKTRNKMLERTLDESLSTRDLDHHIQNLPLPTKGEETRGRRLAVPRNLNDVILQQDRSADDFLNRSEKVWEQQKNGLLAKVHDVSQDECTQERVDQLKAHAQKLRRLADEAVKRAEEAERAYEYVLSLLRKRENPPEAEDSEPDDNRVHPDKPPAQLGLPG
jgi:hypothetical protein